MKLQLSKDEIINQIIANHYDEPEFLSELVDSCTRTYVTTREVLQLLIIDLKTKGELKGEDLIKMFN